MTRRREHGAASLELVILAIPLLAIMSLIFAFARYAQTENIVDQVARDAARSATAQNSRLQVQPAAQEVMADLMANAPSSCRDTASMDAPAYSVRAFQLPDPDDPLDVQWVRITVRCDLDMSDLAGLPFLGQVPIERTFTSPLDLYRGYDQ